MSASDPARHTAGRGLAQLRDAGVSVRVGLLESEGRLLIAPFQKLVVDQLPWVHAKWAMSWDGRIATRSGDSTWVSNEQSRAIVHELRGRMDAIMVGRGTALADDPLLTARPPGPRTAVRIVVDSREDPAWAIVEEAVNRCQATHVQIASLAERRETCSLKCSSVLQAISELDESFEVVALVDADTIPHRNWLRELVAPLADERVGASTGNRWYMPTQPTWGALVRYIWNSAAIVQMYWYRIPWGGTLAIKTRVFRETDVLEKWGNSFCEDTMLRRVLRPLGLSVAFVPSP